MRNCSLFPQTVCPPVLVVSNERVEPRKSCKVDVVCHDHHISHAVFTVQSASSIGDYQGLHPNYFHHTYWHCYLERGGRETMT